MYIKLQNIVNTTQQYSFILENVDDFVSYGFMERNSNSTTLIVFIIFIFCVLYYAEV